MSKEDFSELILKYEKIINILSGKFKFAKLYGHHIETMKDVIPKEYYQIVGYSDGRRFDIDQILLVKEALEIIKYMNGEDYNKVFFDEITRFLPIEFTFDLNDKLLISDKTGEIYKISIKDCLSLIPDRMVGKIVRDGVTEDLPIETFPMSTENSSVALIPDSIDTPLFYSSEEDLGMGMYDELDENPVTKAQREERRLKTGKATEANKTTEQIIKRRKVVNDKKQNK